MPINFDGYLVNVDGDDQGICSDHSIWLGQPHSPLSSPPGVVKSSNSFPELQTASKETVRADNVSKHCNVPDTTTSSNASDDVTEQDEVETAQDAIISTCELKRQVFRVKSHSFNDTSPIELPKVKYVRSKSVSFADDFGKPLTTVKRFFTESSESDILSWCQRRLANTTLQTLSDIRRKSRQMDELVFAKDNTSQNATLSAMFDQPLSRFALFMQHLDTNCICLENTHIQERHIVGTVRVKNMSYHKKVAVRVTYDAWRTHRDVSAWWVGHPVNYTYSEDTCRDNSQQYDRFRFSVPSPPGNTKLEMAICYQANDRKWWDNNGGQNYCFIRKDDTP